MKKGFSESGLVDLVRDLRGIKSNPNGSPVYEERQGGENIRLNNESENAPEQW